MGREGAEHYKKRLQQKAMAKRLAEADGSGLTSKDAQKMIAESLEIQKKANASKSIFSKGKAPYRPNNNRGTDRRDSRPNNRRPITQRPQSQRNPRVYPRGRTTKPKGKKPRPGNRP
jgi:hypothetical protein